MRYLIENKMVVTENGVTTPGLESTEQELSSLPYRLLCFFVANNNQLITKEELFLKIWENYDLTPSGPALATQISSLRRLMAGYGIEPEVLLTRPKQGFEFNAVVETIINEDLVQTNSHQFTNLHTKKPIIGIVLFLSICILLYVIYGLVVKNEKKPWFKIGTIKSCSIFVPDNNMSFAVTSYYLRKAEEFLKESDVKCDDKDKILEYIQHPGISEINDVYETKQFYSYCKWMKESYICNSTYYSAGKTN